MWSSSYGASWLTMCAYAGMTELGNGTSIQSFETTATFRHDTDTFAINRCVAHHLPSPALPHTTTCPLCALSDGD